MKKLFALFALIILAVTPLCLVGCQSKYDNLAIEMEESFNIVLGQDEDDSITVQARVTGASDENGGKLSFSPDNDKLVKISQEFRNGINYITLKALAPGKVNIEARTLEGGVTKNFVVNIIQPIKNFTVKNGNFVVVRGGEWKIDVEKNLNLEPTNATQTNFAVSFAANQDIAGLEIQDNVLMVSKSFAKEEVVLSVSSTDNPDIAPKEIKLTVLDEFVEIDKTTQATQSTFDAGDILVFEKNESMLSYDKLEQINVMSNLLSESERQIVVRVFSTREVDVNSIENSRLSVKKISTLDTLDANGKLQYTDFIFAVRFSDIVSTGTTTNLDFVVKYADFDLSKQLSSIGVTYELAPKTLLVNEQDDLSEFTLYNFYSTSKKGQKLQFGVLPTSVSAKNSRMVLVNKNNLINAFDYVQFFRNNGEELFENDEISANETIYARAKSGVITGSYEVVLQTKFVNPQTGEPISKVLKFNVLAGMTSMEFVDQEQINLQLNSSQNSTTVHFDVKPANVDLTKIHIEEVDGLNFSNIASQAQNIDGTRLKFVVQAQKVGNFKIKVYSENGFEIVKTVKVVEALENVILSVPSPNENSVVGERQIISGELYRVAVSLGGAISLGQTISPLDSNYRVEYSYFETDKLPEFSLSTYDYLNAVSSTSLGVLDYSQLLGYQKIVALKEGVSVVRAKYIPIGIVDNVEKELEPINKYFIVQAYKPIRSVVLSSNYETLYSLKSVGAYNKSLSKTKISLSIYPKDATYADNIFWTYDDSGEYFDFDEDELTLSAKRSYGGTFSIVATIRELNRTYTQTLSLTIVDAKNVTNISVNGMSEGSLYIENTDDSDKTYKLNAVAFPNDAFNTKLRYDFVDQAGNIINDIRISEDGEMFIPAGVGVSGYTRIAAEDCFQENASTGEYEPVGTEGKNIILIPTTIANGTSKETAIRINSRDELQNIDTKKHYIIYNDLDVSGISFETFSGGLYGGGEESRIVLSGIDQTFIKTLSKDGCIEDLEINSDSYLLGDNGVLVGKNEGTINNIVAKGNWTGSLSLVKNNAGTISNVNCQVDFVGGSFGGIAYSNTGIICDCKFMGSITASNQSAGIVVLNGGQIERCATLILDGSSFNLSAEHELTARIAGVCVENKSGGTILRSYVQSYKDGTAFGSDDSTKICGFVHTNNGTIQKCFSALNESEEAKGFVYVNNQGATIENCYSNTTFAAFNHGTIQKCYSVLDDQNLNSAIDCYSGTNATEKKVSDWLKTNWDISCTYEKDTIWKVYLDAQNPFLREVSAEIEPESMTISVREPKSTNSYIKIDDSTVVLYYYESKVSPLTIAEKAKLNVLNSISVYDLLAFDIFPYDASSSPDMFDYELSSGTSIEMSGLNLKVLGLGKQTLTITSKLNAELSYSLDIYTSYPIRDFNIFSSSSSLDPSSALTNGSKIYLKRSYTQPLYAKVSNSIVLVDRDVEFKTFDLRMTYSSAVDSERLGLFIMSIEETVKDYVCALDFSEVTTYEEFEQIKSVLSSIFERVFEVNVYNGAESLFASQYSFEMEPIDSIELKVSLKTDLTEFFDEEGELKENAEVVKCEIFSETGVNLTKAYFAVDCKSIEVGEADSLGFRTFNVLLGIGLKEKTTQVSGNYYIRIYPNEDSNMFTVLPIDISLKLLPQSIQRIDYAHYYAESTVQNKDGKSQEVLKTNTTPSNALAPGQVGLLEVNLFPTYSEISHVEIESIPNQDYTVKLQLYERKEKNNISEFVMVQQNANYNRTENGIIVGYTMITNGTIYVKTQVASNIPEELSFELIVRAYRTKDDLNPVVQHVFLAAKFIPSATVEVDGQKDYVIMGRGTTKNMTITVIGEGDLSISVDDGVSDIDDFKRVFVGRKTLVSQENLGSQNKYVWSCPIAIGSMFENKNGGVAKISVVISREINGVKEKKTTLLTVRVLDFVVDKVILSNGTDKFNAKVSVKTNLGFSFDIAEPQAFTSEDEDEEAVEELKAKIETFKNAQYFTMFGGTSDDYAYKKSLSYIDELGEHTFAQENDSGYTFNKNDYIELADIISDGKYEKTIIKGLKTGTQKMKLKIAASTSDGKTEIYSISYEFDVVVTNYSNEDKPMPIGSLDDFNAIFEQADAQDYILTSDIEISEHVIYSNTSKIRSLDGNNHKIIIKSLELGENQTLDVALFDTINETTTIKNLIVDYQIGEINANSDQFSSINVAGLALNNEGIVTNTHVLSSKGTSTQTTGGIQISTAVSQSTQIQMAGFVLNNSGSITNSRVGDTIVTIVDEDGHHSSQPLKVFALVGQDQMAGFVLNNSGIISASFAKNITIVNNSKFSSNNQTAGFVLNNLANAKITGCYVRGVDSQDDEGVYVAGDGIESSFESAGFVFDNLSYILDSYSNIKLYKETASQKLTGLRAAGFVFKNELGAQIVSSLSLSKIVEDDTSQQQFCGIDEEGSSNNKGIIIYSYYYSQNDKTQSVADGAQKLNDVSALKEDNFYGYVFTTDGALDGMWYMTSRGPDLVSANNIAISKRYLVSTDEENYNVAYVSGYEYGSANNPILIRSATEFNEVFGTSKDDSIKDFYDSVNKQAFGNYRLINDIDLSDLSLGGSDEATLSSTSYTLTRKTDQFGGVIGYGVLEGNSMTISNLDFSTTDTNQTTFGLFASITNGAVVKNLNLTVKEVSASTINYVGSLAGFVEDSKIINVTAGIAQNQQVALVQGKNIVGGVVGAVSGMSELNNISSNISAHAAYVDEKKSSNVNTNNQKNDNPDDDIFVQVAIPNLPTEGAGLNAIVSIAGSVAGAVYCEDLDNQNNKDLSVIDYAQVQKIKASGKFTVSAKIVGGLIGYVGKTTYVHDAWLSIDSEQNLVAHDYGVAGGAVGLSYGKLSHVRIEHNDVQDYSDEATSLQTEIEDNVANYYNNKSNDRMTYENMFTSTNVGQTIGGIVGVMNGGIIEDSYTKLDVISDTAYNLGGIAGIVKNQKYEISRVYTFSNVQSQSTERNILVGGLFGAVLSSGELDTVVGANYLDKNYTTLKNAKAKYVAFAPFAGASTYIPSMANVYTLSKIWNNDDDKAKDKAISDNHGAAITSAKTVITLDTSLYELFPAQNNPKEVNDVFEIEDSHFKNAFWARNVDDVLPHLTFGLEEQYFVIDKVDTAGDIRKMIKNSNKLFYIDGEVNLNTDAIRSAIKQVRESIIFTGSLMGMPKDLDRTYPDETPTLIGLQELFDSAVGATFADFTISAPISATVELPSENFGLLTGEAKDCEFRNITVDGRKDDKMSSIQSKFRSPRNTGTLVGLAEGKVLFESISVSGVQINLTTDENVGLIVGQTSALISKIAFKNCSVTDSKITTGTGSEAYYSKNVGAFVGYSNAGVSIACNNNKTTKIEKIELNVRAQNVGGLVGNCDGIVGISNMNISNISVNVTGIGSNITLATKENNAYVGGLVGQAEGLTIVTNSDINLQGDDDSEYGEIKFTNTSNNTNRAYVGGIAGKINNNLTINKDGTAKTLLTSDMSVSDVQDEVFAGVVVGEAGNVQISNLKVNTQAQIKNKTLTISCKGDVHASGLVGATQVATITECTSGTDVEIKDVTETTNGRNGSCVTFGGIVGEFISVKENSTNLNGNSGDSKILSNTSYGRFHITKIGQLKEINAGGIVGKILKGEVSNNKTLTSLEIPREAKTHNVNAVVGYKDDGVTNGSSGNAYTYQLSLALEDDTKFAVNQATSNAVLDYDTENAEEGSILNPIIISDNTTIENGNYYAIKSDITSAIQLTFPTWTEGGTEKNFVLIGNGNTITLSDSHIDTLGSRTILSGVTVEGIFDYDVSGGSVTIDGTEYTYSSSGLTAKTDDADTITFAENANVGDWEEKSYYDQTITQDVITGQKDGEDVVTNIDSWGPENLVEKTYYYNEKGMTFSNNIMYSILDLEGKASSRSGQYNSGDYIVKKEDKYYLTTGQENGEYENYIVSSNGNLLYKMSDLEYYTIYYMIVEDKAAGEYITLACFDKDYIGYYENSYLIYPDENGNLGAYYPDEDNKMRKCYDVYSIDVIYVSSNKSFNLKNTPKVYTTRIIDGFPCEETDKTISKDGTEYKICKIGGQECIYKTKANSKCDVATIEYIKQITLNGKTYTIKNGQVFDDKSAFVATFNNSKKYVQEGGFVRENNGYVYGVVVKSNYMSSGFGGFVTTNNGTIKYSSMNGQVFNTSSDKDVAGFVLENNGIIDYCHSTGAVQGSATNSYSFGVNNGGTLTNCYSIMLNETINSASSKSARAIAGNKVDFNDGGSGSGSGSSSSSDSSSSADSTTTNNWKDVSAVSSEGKYVFINNGGKFENNYHDFVATQVKHSSENNDEGDDSLNTMTDSLYPTIDEEIDSSLGKNDDGYWKKQEIKADTQSYNYGYKTLSAGPFANITHLSMKTGDGSASTPFIIANSRMLSKIDEIGLGKAYAVANNIDLSWNGITKTNWGNIGLNSTDGGGFAGSFDGNNKTISNLVYQNYSGTLPKVEANVQYKPQKYEDKNAPENSEVFGGLFAKTNGATIKNLTLNNIRIGIATNANVSDSHHAYAGALIAKAADTMISNVKIEASDINASAQNKSYVGGVVGSIENTKNTNSLLISDIYIDKSTSIISQNTMCTGNFKSSSWVGFDSTTTASQFCAYSGGVAGSVNATNIIDGDNCSILTTSSSQVIQMAYFNINKNANLIGEDFLPSSFNVNEAHNSGAYYRDEFIEVNKSETKTYYSAYSYDGKLYGSHCSYHEACYSYVYDNTFTFSISNYKEERDGFVGPNNDIITQNRKGFVLFIAKCYGYNGSDNSGDIVDTDNWEGEWKIKGGESGYPASKVINGVECYRYGIDKTYKHKVYVPTTFIIPKIYYHSSNNKNGGLTVGTLEAGGNYHVYVHHKWRTQQFSFQVEN